MNCIKTIAKNLAKPVFNWLKRIAPRVTEVITQKRIADVIRFTIEFTIDLLFNRLKNCICGIYKTSLSRKQIEKICSKQNLLSPIDVEKNAKETKNVKIEKKKKQ